jgi:hypothetical protein
MMLVYRLPTTEAIYQRFGGIGGSAYFVGGFEGLVPERTSRGDLIAMVCRPTSVRGKLVAKDSIAVLLSIIVANMSHPKNIRTPDAFF